MNIKKGKYNKKTTECIPGTKYDDTKLRWDLLPISEIEEVVKVLT